MSPAAPAVISLSASVKVKMPKPSLSGSQYLKGCGVKAIGAWNYETALSYGKEYKQLISKLRDKPWACLVDLTEWELFTPEAGEHVDELNDWGNINNQKYEVVICSLYIQKALLEKTHEVLRCH